MTDDQEPGGKTGLLGVRNISSADDPLMKSSFRNILSLLNGDERHDGRPIRIIDKWFNYVMEENVPNGKGLRRMLTVLTYQAIEQDLSTEKLERAAELSWLVEIMQAYGLILDDIMDRSTMRRGKLCWYKRDDVGPMAVNDAFFLEQAIYYVLHKKFGEHPMYPKMLSLFREISLTTCKGQCLDFLAERGRLYQPEMYDYIVQTKTSLYTFALPIQLALYLAEVDDEALHSSVLTASIKTGRVFQAQDDFLDCYGIPEVTGKIGTDIVDGKCSWLLVTALGLVSPEQKEKLLDNYAKGKPGGPDEAAVKEIYDELDLRNRFDAFEEVALDDLQGYLAQCEFKFPTFDVIIAKLHRRNK